MICATPDCSTPTPPPSGWKPFRYCRACIKQRQLDRARENMRRRRATPQGRYRVIVPDTVRVQAADSWWMQRPVAGFTAAAAERAPQMGAGKAALIVCSFEIARDAVGR
jgi:hypothetical protein